MTISRRRFLTDASAAGVTAMSGLGSALMSMPVSAAQTEGYKSLVCVFFLGGLDCHDTVFPFDQSSYDRYAEIRAPLLQQYAARSSGPSTRTRERLLLLNPQNAGHQSQRHSAD
ncbi:MAG: twin-arginine translocation signal domain-containing protein [Pseudomonadota bacterium]